MLCAYLYVDKADYSAVTTTTAKTATTAATSKTAKSTSGSSHTTTVQSTTQKQKRRVNINKADAAEIADALLIDDEAAEMIVWLREKIHGYSNILEVLYLEDFDKRYDTEFYNSIKDYIYIE
jgi:DNA uptake protein ComE-like DNA-binding protein